MFRESIERGREAFPKSHWIFYDRYAFFFNPHGVKDLDLPEIETLFDYIVAYSVFTNTSRTDMLDLVAVGRRLTDGGALAFTFIDPNYRSWPDRDPRNNLVWRLEREIYLEKRRTLSTSMCKVSPSGRRALSGLC